MEKGRGASVMDHFQDLEDPRIDRSKRHGLLDILTIAICAVICGADSWVYVEMFGKSKEEWFRSFLDLPNGIPSHDTFGDVFSRLDPDRFQECFIPNPPMDRDGRGEDTGRGRGSNRRGWSGLEFG